jgi:uncharacterized damage-inducible protein DinB
MSQPSASRNDFVSQFNLAAEKLDKAATGLTDAQLDLANSSGGWTIRQIVHHVADDGDVWSMPLKKAIATPGVPIRFEGFPGNDQWADALRFNTRSIDNSLELIKVHSRVMAELARDFTDAWDHSFIVIVDSQGKEMQTIPLEQIIRMGTEHMLEHCNGIEKIKDEHAIHI